MAQLALTYVEGLALTQPDLHGSAQTCNGPAQTYNGPAQTCMSLHRFLQVYLLYFDRFKQSNEPVWPPNSTCEKFGRTVKVQNYFDDLHRLYI